MKIKTNNLQFKSSSGRHKLLFIMGVLILLLLLLSLNNYIFADGNTEVLDKLNVSVFEQLNNLNLNDMQEVLDNLTDEFNLFGSTSFKQKIEGIISGEYFTDYNSVFSAVFSLLFGEVGKLIPVIFTIIAVTLLGQFVASLKGKSDEGVSDLIHFVTYSVVVIIVVVAFKNLITLTSTTLNSVKGLTDAIFPIMLTLLTAVGGVVSVGIYRPTIAILSGAVIGLFSNFIYPLFIFSFVMVVVGNLTDSVKLNKFTDFIFSLFKWTIGFVFTMFGAILAIQGISAGRHDGVSISATRFAIKTYVPIIGGYLSEGLDFILLSSVLIKNAVGVGGLILIFITILSPIIKLVVFKLALQLTAAIVDTVGASKTSNFLNQCSKVILIPTIMLLGVAFMYILTLSLIMCTANLV